MGVKVEKVLIAIDKGKVAQEIEKEFGVPVISMANIEVKEDKVIINSIR